MDISKESTRFVFRDYDDNELSIMRKLISAEGKHFLYEDRDYIACPIGVERYIQKKFPHDTIKYVPPWESVTMKYIPDTVPPPRDRVQKDALKFLRENKNRNQLALVAAPGVGKSYMGIRHAITIGEKTLIICPTTAILRQWLNTLEDMFKIPKDSILYVDGTDKLQKMKENYDWVVVLEQSLQTLVKNRVLEETLKECKFGLKIIDEIHLFLKNNISIDCCSNIKRSLYLTGTYFRSTEEETRLFEAIYHGILRFEITDPDELEKYGQKKHINIYSVIINSKLTRREVSNIIIRAKVGRKLINTVSVGRYMQVVVPEDGRVTEYMKQSLNTIKRMRERVPYGRMLVLVPSINATKRFRQLIADIYPKLKVGCINSSQSRALNERVKEEADIVVSTVKSAGVGFDMSDLSVLVAVEQFRSPVLVEQVSGRLRPRKDGKDTYYVDIADKALGTYLLKWRNDRLTKLKAKSKSYQQFTVSGDK